MDNTEKGINIGLIQRGSVDWVGGVELEKNLVEATLRYAEKEGKKVTFTLLGTLGSGVEAGTVSGDTLRSVQKFSWPPPVVEQVEKKKWWERLSPPDPEKEEEAARKNLRLAKGQFLEELGVDFVYPPFKIPARFKDKSAAWLCDFQHKFLPEYFSEEEVKQRDHQFGAIAKRAGSVVVSSQTAVGHFKQFYPDSKARIIALPFRVILPESLFEADCREVVRKYRLPEKFFIVCNQFWKHKNHAVVLDALERLLSKGVDCQVVLTGRFRDDREPMFTENFLGELHRRGLAKNVSLLGLVPKEDQLQLLRAAHAVIQPSLFEGWSTIVEESHAVGTDIILSDLPVHREQAHPSAVFFDPTDSDALSRAMSEAWGRDRDGCSRGSDAYPELVLDFGKRFYELAKSHQEAGA